MTPPLRVIPTDKGGNVAEAEPLAKSDAVGDDSNKKAPPTGSLAGLRPYLTVGLSLGKPDLNLGE